MLDVNTNLSSLRTQHSLNDRQKKLATAIQRLSSGLRINSAKDDPAGLAISTLMNTQGQGLSVGIRNANDGISLSQVAEGALSGVTNALQQMRSLAVQSANAMYTSADRANLQQEFGQLQGEINRTLHGTSFNGRAILAASAGAQTFQVGPDNNAANRVTVSTANMTTNSGLSVAVNSTTNISTVGGAQAAIGQIDSALNAVSGERARLGAAQNRFDMAIGSEQTTRTNTAAASGRITDANYAAESAALARSQILERAGTAMQAQANMSPQLALRLLR